MKRIVAVFGGLVLAAALVLAAVLIVFGGASRVKQDLTPLAEYRKTQHYDVLISAVKARAIGAEGFRFGVVGDTRSDFGTAQEVMRRAASEAPAFILSNGDIVRKGRWEEYVAHHMPLVKSVEPIPVIPVPGNHEEGPNRDFAAFKAVYGGEQFSFDHGGCRFVGVNNGDRDGVSNADLRFLEAELSKPGVQYKFVVVHVPPRFLSNYVEAEDGRGFRKNASRFHQLMTRMRVDHVFLGHIHGYATEVVDGVRYTITGGGGATLTTALGEGGNVYNYIVVHVSPHGLRNEVVRKLDGEWGRTAMR